MKYVVTFALTGGITIEADTKEDAIKQFEQIDGCTLYENAGEFEWTDIFAEED